VFFTVKILITVSWNIFNCSIFFVLYSLLFVLISQDANWAENSNAEENAYRSTDIFDYRYICIYRYATSIFLNISIDDLNWSRKELIIRIRYFIWNSTWNRNGEEISFQVCYLIISKVVPLIFPNDSSRWI